MKKLTDMHTYYGDADPRLGFAFYPWSPQEGPPTNNFCAQLAVDHQTISGGFPAWSA
jgi:hypothetical protein